MISKSEWQAVNRRLMADDRERLGDPPTAEEWLAYSRGELSEQDEANVRARLACHPELVRSLMEPFPTEGAAPGDPDYLSDEQLEVHWASMKARISAREAARGRQLQWWRIASAIAAALAVLFGALLWEARRDAAAPRVWEDQLLLPDGRRGGESAPFLSARGESIVLLLARSGEHYERYRLELIEQSSQRKIWSAPAPQPRDANSFVVVIPRSFLRSGGYQVVVHGAGPGAEQRVATYSFRVPR